MSVGIDMGSKTVKIVDLVPEGNSWRLKSSGILGYTGNMPEEAKDDKELVPLADAIRKLHKEAKVSSKEVCIAIPEVHVYCRTVKFPLLTDSEITSAVRWEAEQYIPIPVKEAVIQHKIVERREDVVPGRVSVLLIAASKALIQKYVKVIEMAGLAVKSVETQSLALVRSLSPENMTAMITDLGARSTNIAISKQGELIFSRSISVGGEAFTRAISQFFGIEAMQAEEYKRTYGMSASKLQGRVKQALEPVFVSVADEIKKAIHYYQSEEDGEAPKSIILSGGTSALPEASLALTKFLGMEVIIGNPFSKVVLDPSVVKSVSGFAPFYSIAVGLAMHE
ncbi:MAG: type IV pilus assembly protein PilM [Patescibacteria group bacterium]|nr:type IV pilus assembly protein PilM [Patescibacteria group bacterium]